MFHIGPWELALIIVILIFIFGPRMLPDIGRSVGQTIQELKKAFEGKKAEEGQPKEEPPKDES
jgi:TatA/E family protein of Tat protein translocase